MLPLALVSILHASGMTTGYCRGDDEQEGRVENASFSMRGDAVIITFDLVGSPDDSYILTIRLRKGDDSTMSIVPQSLVGDVGEVRGGGKRKVVVWNYRNDVPETFKYADDYWFEIQAVPKPGGLPVGVLIALGIAAGVTAYALSSSGADEPGGSVPSGLPAPPTIRPDP
jgi:hypothetical protein